MEKTPKQIAALREEIQNWMGKNGLAGETAWRTVEQVHGPDHLTFLHPYYLVLCTEGDLHNVFWGNPPEVPTDRNFGQLKQEFIDMLRTHGCRYEWKDHVTLSIIDRNERTRSVK